MNKVIFFIASVQLDYVIRFYAKAEAIVAEYCKRYPDYLFHVKKIETYLFCFTTVSINNEENPIKAKEYLEQLKNDVLNIIPSQFIFLEAINC